MPSKKWTPEQRKKFIATMAAKRRVRTGVKAKPPTRKPNGLKGIDQTDAITFLRQARQYVNKAMAAKKLERMDYAHLLLLLALSSLEGEQPE